LLLAQKLRVCFFTKEKNSGNVFIFPQGKPDNIVVRRPKATQLFFLPEAYTSFGLAFRQAANLKLRVF